MSKVHHLVGAALACELATSANAQLLQHKDLSNAMATTIALAAVEACKAAGYNVSVHVVGRNGEVLVGLRHHAAGVNTFENSWKKAYTSRTFRFASGTVGEDVDQDHNRHRYTCVGLQPRNRRQCATRHHQAAHAADCRHHRHHGDGDLQGTGLQRVGARHRQYG
jgi:hypothetical protein